MPKQLKERVMNDDELEQLIEDTKQQYADYLRLSRITDVCSINKEEELGTEIELSFNWDKPLTLFIQ